jgi:spore coat polysaccharide biosynthesis protein SpsF (cytidylyltransferase family)
MQQTIKLSGYTEALAQISKDSQGTTLNTDQDYKMMEAMNQKMEEVKRDFELKNMASQISASKVVLTN